MEGRLVWISPSAGGSWSQSPSGLQDNVHQPSFEERFPRTGAEIQRVYDDSEIRKRMGLEDDYPRSGIAKADTDEFQQAAKEDKAGDLPKNSPLTVPLPIQIYTCIIRQYQIIWGDKATFAIKQITCVVQALIAGSLFYNAPNNSAGLFVKGGALFFALLYNALVAMSETTESFTGRPVLAKHKEFAFYRPAAFCIAQITADLPIIFVQVTLFSVILYWMVALKATAGAFFTFWVLVYSVTICMTALFRLVGAAFSSFDAASKVSGFAVTALVTYIGYQIPKPEMHPWFVWIYWINPMSYGFESLAANEFHDRHIPCFGKYLIPSGQGYDDTYAACAGVRGAEAGANFVTGDQYLSSLSYSNSHLWRNFGGTVYFGNIGDNAAEIKDYFERNGAPCPPGANPADHMIDVVSGSLSHGKDWNKVWLESSEYTAMMLELDHIIDDAASKPPGTVDDGHEFALSIWEQTKLVTHRMNVSLYRNTNYTTNKFALHIGSALFNGFTFWKIGHSVAGLQLTLFVQFNFVFVAPGVIAQLQPLFIERRDLYEAREKKSKMYHWAPFVTGLIVSELPYLVICAILYYICYYYTAGLPSDSSKAGAIFFVMLMYEFLYTGIGQFIAAYAPNAVFASLVNPLLIGILVSFCGVLVPYSQIQAFWRYWLYYLNPFSYLMGSLLLFPLFDKSVRCKESEFAIFDTPNGQTCREYLSDYLNGSGSRTNLTNPDATSGCRVCQYSRGSDYLYTVNLKDYYYGWRDNAIVIIFVVSSYALVYVMMKLRTKATKKAE
ncbi:ABC-2 type transporter-domain-containing protein [Exophiala viscosa]|uniref:ABC-2 type transporter-domain-containing protein n=1 Tax=Exophiala viscosa TaxID=2486360 RepID=UPI00218CAED9|nr:ABC-2 type transporter-domain-containing protein [Exophiala viscosa]